MTSGAGRVAVFGGFVLLVAVGALIAVSGLIMPYWAVGSLAVIWLVALVTAIQLRARPGAVLALPFVLMAIWVIAAWAGERFLDWTA
jgi:hypothetical protein